MLIQMAEAELFADFEAAAGTSPSSQLGYPEGVDPSWDPSQAGQRATSCPTE